MASICAIVQRVPVRGSSVLGEPRSSLATSLVPRFYSCLHLLDRVPVYIIVASSPAILSEPTNQRGERVHRVSRVRARRLLPWIWAFGSLRSLRGHDKQGLNA